jgi:hypothetical protein
MEAAFTTETQSAQRTHRVIEIISLCVLCVLCVSVVNLIVLFTQDETEPLSKKSMRPEIALMTSCRQLLNVPTISTSLQRAPLC